MCIFLGHDWGRYFVATVTEYFGEMRAGESNLASYTAKRCKRCGRIEEAKP
jgi:hypothetical protein